ncbi:hypothetical protein CPB83DRAFT_900391 [Crepidotus variabilis]|uniref:peptidylprolyl isomerase n=1 Tax=Crepidotus variabilis TaxID=179855 RepID=A0A9P6JI26_9AGAR|nr:hypothetical protein CPB83DRAFT_900391 [Crepidotus variabilis]
MPIFMNFITTSLPMSQFWSQTLKPQDSFKILSPDTIHVQNATLGHSLTNTGGSARTSLHLTYVTQEKEEKETYVCSLTPGKIEHVSLNLVLTGDTVFHLKVIGRNSIYLSGTLNLPHAQQQPSQVDVAAQTEPLAATHTRPDSEDRELATIRSTEEGLHAVGDQNRLPFPELPSPVKDTYDPSTATLPSSVLVNTHILPLELGEASTNTGRVAESKASPRKRNRRSSSPKKQLTVVASDATSNIVAIGATTTSPDKPAPSKRIRKSTAKAAQLATNSQAPTNSTPISRETNVPAAPSSPAKFPSLTTFNAAVDASVPKGNAHGQYVTSRDVKLGDKSGACAVFGREVSLIFRVKAGESVVFSDFSKNPHRFCVGNQDLVPGLSEGVTGMRKGGQRVIRVPASHSGGELAFIPRGLTVNSELTIECQLVDIF